MRLQQPVYRGPFLLFFFWIISILAANIAAQAVVAPTSLFLSDVVTDTVSSTPIPTPAVTTPDPTTIQTTESSITIPVVQTSATTGSPKDENINTTNEAATATTTTTSISDTNNPPPTITTPPLATAPNQEGNKLFFTSFTSCDTVGGVQDCGTFEHWVNEAPRTVGPGLGGGIGGRVRMIGGIGIVLGLEELGVF